MLIDLVDDECCQVWLHPEHIHVGGHKLADELVHIRALDHQHPDFGQKGLDGFLEDDLEQLVLAAEVIVKQGLVDPGPVCDVLHAGTGHSLFQEYGFSCSDDAFFGRWIL